VENAGDITIIDTGDWTTDDWDEITSLAIVDGSGSANIIAYDNANIVDQTPATGDIVKFLAGDLDITLS
jgi:hypothetical protein